MEIGKKDVKENFATPAVQPQQQQQYRQQYIPPYDMPPNQNMQSYQPMPSKTSWISDTIITLILTAVISMTVVFAYHKVYSPKMLANSAKFVAVDFYEFMQIKQGELMVNRGNGNVEENMKQTMDKIFTTIRRLSSERGLMVITSDVAIANIPVIKFNAKGDIYEVVVDDATGKHKIDLDSFIKSGKIVSVNSGNESTK